MEKKSRKKSLGIMGAKGEKKKNEEKTERSFLQKSHAVRDRRSPSVRLSSLLPPPPSRFPTRDCGSYLLSCFCLYGMHASLLTD